LEQTKKTRKRSTRKKSRSPATTRQTAGPGFAFEDQTAAWLLTKILTGDELPGVGVAANLVQSQTSALKWQIDDLLVTADETSVSRHLAVSCKSNLQVTANGLPAEFVNRAWGQWRNPESPMRRETDVLALVTRGRHTAFTPTWSDIQSWCSGEDAKLAIARIRKTRKHTRIFESVKAPRGSIVATDEETVQLIQHLAVIPVDFQLEPSTSLDEAIRRCRSLLKSGSRDEAAEVWAELERLATKTRVGSGTLTLNKVWTTLRTKFGLKDHPNFGGSWTALRALTKEYKAQIETALPSGFIIDRAVDKTKLAELLRDQPITVVFGESGSGKSALIKSTLDEEFSTWNQVWLGPEQADTATSESNRPKLHLAQPLHKILQASTAPKNVLVIDSAERLNIASFPLIRQLIQDLELVGSATADMPWRIVIVSQSEGSRDRLQAMIGQPVQNPLAVEGISVEDVKAALCASGELRWLTTRDDTVAALTNLRTLGWVIQASTAFQSGSADLTSPPAIADRIWEFWTEGKAGPQNFLIRLGIREAEFVRSFALSELDAADAATFENKPAHLPLRKNSRNRIEFDHDLAADWARFQRLKEIADDVDQWSTLANNPLWSGALRLLGQFLLREPAGSSTAWDAAFSDLEAKDAMPAADVLLDALFLDPQANKFLNDRAELLFANHGSWLKRLLRRFLHIATVPSAPPALLNIDQSLGLYIEDKYRMPIIGLWPTLTNFLHAHIEQVADLVSPTVAMVCEVWLTTTPRQLEGGVSTPFRKELAEIALATARALQVEQSKGVIYVGDGEQPIYSAALAGGADLPDEVTTWALELAQRRPQAAEVATKVAEARAKAAAEHAERLSTDPDYRARQKELTRRRSSAPLFIPGSRKLPPWPMGPNKRVKQGFQKVCLHSTALGALMHVRPERAAEILLALLIEGEPEEEHSPSLLDENVGLEYDHGDSYPTAFWKSQFFLFLNIAPDVALTTLIQLVNFCTERWAHDWTKDGNASAPSTVLTMGDGSDIFYVGNWRVFDWTQANSNFIGQLHCALNALERWLTLQIEQGSNVEPYLERLLQESSSIALVGLLVNVAKFRPALLSGVLMPLLGSEDVFWFDQGRVQNARYQFDSFTWSRAGNAIFNLARDWTMAPYRQQNLVQVVSELIPRDKAIASFLKAAIAKWDKPDDRKAAVEFGILRAQLDEANYRASRDPDTGVEVIEFEYPEAIKMEVADYERTIAPKLQNVLLAGQCEKVLQGCAQLTDTSAQTLADVLSASSMDEEDEGTHTRNKLAAASTLIANAQKWLNARPEVGQVARSVLCAEVETISHSAKEIRCSRIGGVDERLKFAAYGVFHLWLQGDNESGKWEHALLRLLTSGDNLVAGVLGILAHRHRNELGHSWWRLLHLGVLWSALSMFGPSYGDPPNIEVRWGRWVQWLRSRRISGVPCNHSSLDLLGVWQRLKRLERDRWRRDAIENPSSFRRTLDERSSHGLDTGFLTNLFGWLLVDSSRPDGQDLEVGHEILLALWAYQVEYCFEHRDEHGVYRLGDHFGYNILAKLACYAAHVPAESAAEIWRGVLSLGPAAHRLIDCFISAWFSQLHNGCDPTEFCKRWCGMIEFALDADWTEGRHWFDGQRMLQKLLGFGSETSINELPDPAQTVLSMRDHYRRWAEANLAGDESNVTALSYFLVSEAGAALRIDGLKWLAANFEDAGRDQYWRERRGTGDALVNLLNTALTDDATVLATDGEVREALVALAAYVAARQVPAALALQERIRHLR